MNREIQMNRLSQGQTATVLSLSAQGSMRRRLQDMGLIAGTEVECVGISPLGDPAAYLIRGALVALRGRDAADILVRPAGDTLEKASGLSLYGNANRSVAE